jgi:hypothetical protein
MSSLVPIFQLTTSIIKDKEQMLKKELTTSKKKISDQMEKQLAHKEQMKNKEIERERINAKKSKDNNYTKLPVEERKHANAMVCTE